MGSFDYNDDYSSFDNLLERTTLLTEGGKGLGGYHPGLGGALTSRLKDAGSEAFTRDARLFAVHILFGASIITDEEESALTQPGMPAGGKNYRLTLMQILDNHKDEIIERADEISDAIEERFPAFANDILGRDPERIKNNISKREVKLANDEIQRGIKSGEDPVDVITDGMEKVLANAAVFTTLTNAQGRVDDKDLDTVEKYATQFVNGFNDVDILIKKLKTFDTENFNVLADELSNSLSSAKGNAGIGEDNEDPEEDPDEPDEEFANAPGGVPGSWEMGQEGGETTSIVDSLNNDMRKKKLLFEKKKNWGKFRSNRKQKLVVEKDLDAAERRALPDKDFVFPGKGEGPEGKQAGSYPIPDEKHARSALSLVSQHGTPEEKKKVRAAVAREFPNITQEDEETGGQKLQSIGMRDKFEGFKRFLKDLPYGSAQDPVRPDQYGLTEEEKEEFYSKYGLTTPISQDDINKFLSENEEAGGFSMSPMLDSYRTSTAGYLTEQTSKDKRNKKPEVKNQSFKERYKPKTSRQLEELRRYGL